MAALFLGCTSCLAQASRCPLQNNENTIDSNNPNVSEKTIDTIIPITKANALSFLQDIDKMYYL